MNPNYDKQIIYTSGRQWLDKLKTAINLNRCLTDDSLHMGGRVIVMGLFSGDEYTFPKHSTPAGPRMVMVCVSDGTSEFAISGYYHHSEKRLFGTLETTMAELVRLSCKPEVLNY
jgi:hypothetical protein